MIGNPPVLQYLDIDDLHVNQAYQRGVESRKSKQIIQTIAKNFDWNKFQPVLVSKSPSGKRYSIIDGQHRVLAALQRGDIEQIPCCVVELPAIEDQAKSFVGVNKVRVALHPMQIFRASVAAGDASALKLQKFLREIDMIVPGSPAPSGLTKPNEVQAIGTLQRIFKRTRGPAALRFALTSIREAYPGDLGQQRAAAIQALSELHLQGIDLAQDVVIKVLHKIDPETWQDHARAHTKKRGGSLAKSMVAVFVEEYNLLAPPDGKIPEKVSGHAN